jgi:hypothetical protein
MKLQNIIRIYGSSFKFFYNNKGSVKEYNRFVENNEPEKVKDITVPYYEESLHIIYTYSTIFKYFIPTLSIIISIFIKSYSLLLIVVLVSYLIHLYLKKQWKITCSRYMFEMIATDYYINQKFHINKITDLNELGEIYLQKISK